MIVLAALAVLLPFLGAVGGLLLGPRLSPAFDFTRRRGPELFAVVPVGIMTVLTGIVAFQQWWDPGVRDRVFATVPTGTMPIEFGLSVDGLAAVVAFMVGCVALAVQVYSVSYLKDEPRYSSYAAFISLFTAAMLLVVYADDLMVLYVGWEIMGLCSYFLIGHHWEEAANSRAAVKAFLTTRVGDVGFLLGAIVLAVGAHSFQISTIMRNLEKIPHGTLVAATLLILVGVAGKSAQFPLHTWLPDAMAGPTPISALIHAATMVAAGVYVVARLYPAFVAAPVSLAVLGVMASISMVGAACAALAQRDLKRVLAYSTISQLGYMAAGLAVGAKSAAMFHLITHGAFKALLFLAAGSVIHTVGSNLLSEMGGLRQAMPVTFVTMTIGYAALAGLPPASGFFSKDSIIEAAQLTAFHGGEIIEPSINATIPGWVSWIVYLSLLGTAALTAAYVSRAWLMTFFGAGPDGAHEAPPLMSRTLVALAVPALVLGFFGLGAAELQPHFGSAGLSLIFVAAGAAVVVLAWRDDPVLDPARRLGPVRTLFERAFYVDDLYDLTVVRPVRRLASVVAGADRTVVDATVESTVPAARGLGRLVSLPQGGNPQTYLTGVLAGAVLLVLAVVALT
ncbi:MAG: NADH-quinone oxidoreductase subunit L [Streptosporangiaceae bacterium]